MNQPVDGLFDLFPGDCYSTPPDHPVSIWDRLFFNSRWPLYFRFIINVLFKSRRQAVKGEYDRKQWVQASHDIMKCIELSGGKFHIEGLNHLRGGERSLVIVANHMSTLETLILPALIASIRPATFIVKKSLINGPVFGPIMRSRNPIVVGRENPRQDLEQVLKEGSQRLASGLSIILFPESTRQKTFDIKKFNSLGVKLARKAGVPVLPLALKTDFWGTGAVLRPFGPVRRKKTIHFKFGTPLPISGNGHIEHDICTNFISDQLKNWHHAMNQSGPESAV